MPAEKTNTTDAATAEVVLQRGPEGYEEAEYHGPPILSPEAKAWLCGLCGCEMFADGKTAAGQTVYEIRRCTTDSEHVNLVPIDTIG